MFINKGVYLRFVTDELELRTLQLLSVRNLAAIDAHRVMYITAAYQKCVRIFCRTLPILLAQKYPQIRDKSPLIGDRKILKD